MTVVGVVCMIPSTPFNLKQSSEWEGWLVPRARSLDNALTALSITQGSPGQGPCFSLPLECTQNILGSTTT